MPTLKRQPSDNAVSLWGKILLRREIKEKKAENNLFENQSNIKGTKGVCAPTLHQHRNELTFCTIKKCSFNVSIHRDHSVFANVYFKKKTANTVRPGSVSVTESGFISQQKRSESSVSWGAFVLTSDREQK